MTAGPGSSADSSPGSLAAGERRRAVVTSLVWGILAGLAVWSLLPAGFWWAGASREGYVSAWQTWTWGAAIVALFSALLMVVTRGRVVNALIDLGGRLTRVPASRFVAAVTVLLAALSVFVCLAVFSGNPRSVDGFAQLFQARIFLAGHAWVPPPPELANFGTLHMILGPDRWYSQYPPGQPALLAAGLMLGTWWATNPLVTAVLILGVYRVARWCGDESSARLAIALALLSPFLLATAGSEMNHLAAAALGIGAAACTTALDGRNRWLPAIGAGAGLGILTAFRPLDAVAAAVPVAAIALATAPRRVAALAAIGAAGVVFTIPTLAYNEATTGNWHTFGYAALWGPGVSLGFHPVPWGTALTFPRAVGLTGLDLHQLNTYALDLPIPMLAVVAAGLVVGRRFLTVRDGVPVLAVLALSGLLFFYWHRDVLYGPRLLFSALPWYLMLLARAVVLPPRAGRRGMIWTLTAVVALLVGLVTITPARFRTYRDGTPTFDFHPDRDARQAGITQAVVVIPDGWGTRLIARLWAAGVPVRSSARFYSAIDACSLERVLDEGDRNPAFRPRMLSALEALAGAGNRGTPAGLTDDPNLRLVAGEPLAPECREEIAFDQRHGVLAFAPFLYLNTPSLDGDIVWARDLGPHNRPLFARYSGRRVFRYAQSEPGGPPVFTPLDAPGL